MLSQKVLFYVQQSKDFMLSRLMQIRILQAGDQIVKLDGQHLEEFYRMHRAYFTSSTPERNYREWSELISKAVSDCFASRSRAKPLSCAEPSQNPIESRFGMARVRKGCIYSRLMTLGTRKPSTNLYCGSNKILSSRAVVW